MAATSIEKARTFYDKELVAPMRQMAMARKLIALTIRLCRVSKRSGRVCRLPREKAPMRTTRRASRLESRVTSQANRKKSRICRICPTQGYCSKKVVHSVGNIAHIQARRRIHKYIPMGSAIRMTRVR